MLFHRNGVSGYNLTNGPGKLAQAFNINKLYNGQSLQLSPLYIAEGKSLEEDHIIDDHRVGIESFGDAALWPLRFFEKNNPYVSVKKAKLYA
ncbi:MAG: DNA-3-methyladenine glycosylase [Bdellovibrionales bacterium]